MSPTGELELICNLSVAAMKESNEERTHVVCEKSITRAQVYKHMKNNH